MHSYVDKKFYSCKKWVLHDHSYPRVSRCLKSIYTLQGKNLMNSSYAWLPTALTYDNHLRSPYYIKIGPLPMGEVLALGLIPPPTTSWRQRVQFEKVVTGLLGSSGPIKTRHLVNIQLKVCHWGPNSIVLNRHRWGLLHRNLRIATTLSPSSPSECSTDPPTWPTWSSNSK
jgi:hypothetical protein